MTTGAPAGPERAFHHGEDIGGFRLVRRIGAGSQAEVWEAVPSLGGDQPVALRMMRLDLPHRPRQREAFLRAAELTRPLRGQWHLPTLATGESRGVAFQALPLVRGASLAEAIAHRREELTSGTPGDDAWWVRLRPREYRRAMIEAMAGVARALAEAHHHGVVHRDVKPANILLDRDRVGHARLADFGLGTETGTDPAASAVSGTPMYMAPERLLGQACDPVRGDIFALGLTLHEALTLSRPRTIPDGLHRSLVPAHLAAIQPPTPRSICPGISRLIEAVILRAIDPDPASRYHRVHTMVDDIDSALRIARRTERDVLGRPVSTP